MKLDSNKKILTAISTLNTALTSEDFPDPRCYDVDVNSTAKCTIPSARTFPRTRILNLQSI